MSKGVGLDIGTMNLVSARMSGAKKNEVTLRRMRDLFIDLPSSAKKMLKLGSVSYIEADDNLLVLGDEAMEVANMFGREGRRPLKAGLISADEINKITLCWLKLLGVIDSPSQLLTVAL